MIINQTIKTFFSRATLTMLATLLIAMTAQPAWAETVVNGVKYIDANGVEQTKDGVIVLTGSETKLGVEGTESSPTETWYLCDTNRSYTSTLSSYNYCNVNIILADGVEMSVESSSSNAFYILGSLGIYGQSTGTNRGALTAKGTSRGIWVNGSGNNVTISGAKVTATGDRAIYSSGGGVSITGSKVTATGTERGIFANGDDNGDVNLTIIGSEVTATATGTSGYAIFSSCGSISISDAEVTATATATSGYAICSNSGGVSITGGKVTANGTKSGIEACGSDKDITIIGAEVEATATGTSGYAIIGKSGGVSITGGKVTAKGTYCGIEAWGSDKDITIKGAEVTATADGTSGHAIYSYDGGVSITGGKITANGKDYGIAACGFDKDVTIKDAEVTAEGKYAIYTPGGGISITGGKVTSNGTDYGIGAGGSGKDITISGAEVTATADGSSGNAIYSSNGGVSITGGKVTSNGKYYGIGAGGSDKDITISGAEVTATGKSAIGSSGAISITDGSTVTASGTSEGIFTSIYGDVTIIGSKVTATATDDINDKAIYSWGGSISISDAEVTAEGNNAIYTPGGGISITGGKVTANGIEFGIEASGSDKNITIEDAEVTATANGTSGNAIYTPGGGISITGGKVTANGTDYGIRASQDITIEGAEVTATATGTSGSAIYTYGGSASITGGKVTANGTEYGINGKNGVDLKWTNTTDFIMASSYMVNGSAVVKFADGQRFVAFTVDNTNPESPVENGSAIIAGTVSDLATIAGMMLRPLDGYLVSLPSGLSIDGKTRDFAIGSTSYYNIAENASVTVKTDSQQGFEFTGTNVPATTFNADYTQATFAMPAGVDVAITGLRYCDTKVPYIDADGNQATTPAANGTTPATKVYVLDGSETTLGVEGQETWYISNTTGDGLAYNHQITFNGNVHLILADNSKMTVTDDTNYPFNLSPGSSNHNELYIYGQGGTTEGKLTVTSANSAAIHGNSDTDIIINGGIVSATGQTAISDINSYVANGGKVTLTSTSGDVYKVTFDGNEWSDIPEVSLYSGSTVAEPTAPARKGYIFAGWKNGSTPYDFNMPVTDNLALVSVWKKLLTNTDITIGEIADQTYTGSEIKPAITVKDGTTDITDQCDITFANNKVVGTATVTIKAKAASTAYAGETTKTFEIILKGDINGDKVVNVADIVKAINDGRSQKDIKEIEKIIMKK